MRRQQLEAEISSALSDGVISSDEREKIDDLRQRLNITEEDALAIIGYLQRKSDQKWTRIEITLDISFLYAVVAAIMLLRDFLLGAFDVDR